MCMYENVCLEGHSVQNNTDTCITFEPFYDMHGYVITNGYKILSLIM